MFAAAGSVEELLKQNSWTGSHVSYYWVLVQLWVSLLSLAVSNVQWWRRQTAMVTLLPFVILFEKPIRLFFFCFQSPTNPPGSPAGSRGRRSQLEVSSAAESPHLQAASIVLLQWIKPHFALFLYLFFFLKEGKSPSHTHPYQIVFGFVFLYYDQNKGRDIVNVHLYHKSDVCVYISEDISSVSFV